MPHRTTFRLPRLPRATRLAVALACALTCASAGLLAADPAPEPLAELAAPDGAALLAHWAQGPLARAWADPGVAALHPRFDGWLAGQTTELGFDPLAVLAGARHLRLALDGIGHDEQPRVTGQVQLTSGAAAVFAAIAKHGTPDAEGGVVLTDDEGRRTRIVRQDDWLLLASPDDGQATGHRPVAGGHDATVRLDGPRLAAALAANGADPAERAAWDLLPTLAGTFDLVPAGVAIDLRSPQRTAWLAPLDLTVAATLPTGISDLTLVGIDGPELWRTTGPLARALLAEGAKDPEWHDPLGELADGLTWEQLISGLTGTWGLAASPASPLPAYTLLVPRSPAIDRLLAAIATRNGITLPAEGASGILDLPTSLPVTVTVARTARHWLATTDPLLATTWLGAPPADGGVLASPVGILAKAKAPAGTAVLMTSDTAAQIRSLIPLVAMMGGVVKDVTPAEKQALMKFLTRLAALSTPAWNNGANAADGLHGYGEGLLLGGNTMTIAVLAGIALPALNASRHQGQRQMSGNNLRQIALAAAVYCNDNDNRFPRDLPTLIKETGGDLTPKIMHSPAAPQRDDAYLYVRPANAAPGSQPLVIEDPACWKGAGANVVFVDGHVVWIPRGRAQRVWTEAMRLAALPAAKAAGITARDWAKVWDDLEPGQAPPPEPAPAEKEDTPARIQEAPAKDGSPAPGALP